MTGKVYLVGSGPGGTGLLTQRAADLIEKADVIFYDQLPGEEILATLPKKAEKFDCGKFGGKHTLEQHEIENEMVARAKEGKTIVRLKGGDPFLFGRGGEELETLREAGIGVEMVPGVTSALAVPA
ncbi:MAG: SAM-dependent methyltransferase, partial [Methanoregula sp.]